MRCVGEGESKIHRYLKVINAVFTKISIFQNLWAWLNFKNPKADNDLNKY